MINMRLFIVYVHKLVRKKKTFGTISVRNQNYRSIPFELGYNMLSANEDHYPKSNEMNRPKNKNQCKYDQSLKPNQWCRSNKFDL